MLRIERQYTTWWLRLTDENENMPGHSEATYLFQLDCCYRPLY